MYLCMTSDRVTVSLHKAAEKALEGLTERTSHGQRELFRRALTVSAGNYEAATTDAGTKFDDEVSSTTSGSTRRTN